MFNNQFSEEQTTTKVLSFIPGKLKLEKEKAEGLASFAVPFFFWHWLK